MTNCFPNSTDGEIPVTASAPYPEVRIEKPNRAYARILMQDIASTRGEMTAIYQYLYQSWILEDGFEELAQTLFRITKVEMHHLQVIGELIFLLGGDPRCFSPMGNSFYPWNGNMLNYSRSVKRILADNAALEQSAVDSYTAQAMVIEDNYVSAILNRFALDEEIHKHIFEDFLARLLP